MVFWAPLGLEADDVADLAEAFVDRSLGRWADADRTALTLHDLQHDYLRATLGAEGLRERHRRLLRAWAQTLGAADYPDRPIPWAHVREQGRKAMPGYFWRRAVHHHLEAGWPDAPYRLLTDFDYLEADYRVALARWPQEDADRPAVLAALEERLRLEDHHITADPTYLFPALYNHLTWWDAPNGPLHALCEAATRERRD